MKIRKHIAAVATVGLALTLAACGGASDDPTTPAAGGETATTAAPEETGSAEETEAAGGDFDPSGMTVGVAMPTQTSERWIADGDAVKAGFEDAGFDVNLVFAADDIPTQQQQIDQLITQGADLLIVAAIDGVALGGQLQAAADAGIPVVSYDRLIRETENITYYVTFDNEEVGVQQATSLLVGLGLLNQDGSDGDAAGPFNIELFAGSLDDNNAHFFWKGAIDTL
nr:substrate-binding domain-containing protein [Actinomycetales bacterium]